MRSKKCAYNSFDFSEPYEVKWYEMCRGPVKIGVSGLP